ncbi:MAG: glycosyltransferase [Bacteroidales bacterium]|nr:glycosyltransferase [Bacteroidales bacterium]
MDKLFIGPLPPPIGGVANHVLRYSISQNIPVFNEKNKYTYGDFKKLFCLTKTKIYVHTTSWKILVPLLLKLYLNNKGCKFYFINHNFEITYSKPLSYKAWLIFWGLKVFIRKCNVIFVVNRSLIKKMQPIYGNLMYHYYNPFKPPILDSELMIINGYGSEIHEFINDRRPLLSSGAWHLSFTNGVDLYGLDLLLELINRLKINYPEIGLIFGLADSSFNKGYFHKCNEYIVESGIQNNVMFLKEQQELWPLIKRSHLFIRATATDGDPLSIQEALFFNTPVLASDCTIRDSKVHLFHSRDIESLVFNSENILIQTIK